MLTRLRKPFRLKAALALAALYALCVLAPNAALAFGNGAAHCLTENTPAHVHMARAEAPAHAHADGTVHDHGGIQAHDERGAVPHKHSGSDGKSSGTCCGLFCLSAMALEPAELSPAPMVRTAAPVLRVDALAGRAPGRLNRPPIA